MDKVNEKIEELHQKMQPRLIQYANAALQNPDLAAEAVQDVFRIACTDPQKLLSSPNPEGWLMNTLKYVVQNIRRAEAKQSRLAEKLNSTILSSTTVDRSGDVNAKLLCRQVLSAEDYRLVDLIIFQRYTLGEAAGELGISLEVCKKRYQRAKKTLKSFLAEN